MQNRTAILLSFIGYADLVDESGHLSLIEATMPETVGKKYPAVDLEVAFQPAPGISGLRDIVGAGKLAAVSDRQQIVVLSLVNELDRLRSSGSAESALVDLRDDLISAIQHIKAETGAHVLLVNVSTIDPTNLVANYHGLEEAPFSLCAHRLNSLLISVSHETGVSVIDVDRVLAEKGGGISVTGPGRYSSIGLESIVEEMLRVIEDYGFFDERPVLEQIGTASER